MYSVHEASKRWVPLSFSWSKNKDLGILHIVKKSCICNMCRKLFWQGSKKVPSSGPGQVDFVSGQVTFKAHLHNKQWSRQSWITKEIIK